MPEEPSEFPHLRRLKEAAVKFRQGWAKDHPISEKHLAAVRETIREEWTKEQKLAQPKSKEPQTHEKSPAHKKGEEQNKQSGKNQQTQSKSKGQSH